MHLWIQPPLFHQFIFFYGRRMNWATPDFVPCVVENSASFVRRIQSWFPFQSLNAFPLNKSSTSIDSFSSCNTNRPLKEKRVWITSSLGVTLHGRELRTICQYCGSSMRRIKAAFWRYLAGEYGHSGLQRRTGAQSTHRFLLAGPWTFSQQTFSGEDLHKGKHLNSRCITLLALVREDVGCSMCVSRWPQSL